MPGNPEKEGRKNPQYQMGRRRFTVVPGYFSVLPRVFPFRVRCSREHASHLIGCLFGSARDGFAVTSHPKSFDGHVHVWLSTDCAEYLESLGEIPSGGLEATN